MPYSISRINLFKSCRRAYQLKYIEGLRPVETADALEIGKNYHEKLETLYKTGELDTSDLSKESAMAAAYKKYIYPQLDVVSVEEWTDLVLDDETIIGRPDGMTASGKLIEHKTTSMDPLEFEYDLQWNEQILLYMVMTHTRDAYFTVCRKPTIRLKKNETEEDFFNRMVVWYDEDTDSKIKIIHVNRTDQEVDEFVWGLREMIGEMKRCKYFYRNTSYCKHWGRRCEYASVCMHYDPNQEYVEFVKE